MNIKMSHPFPGAFITLEGGEGCGKSTQYDRAVATLRKAYDFVVVSREPGGTPLGERIRGVVLDPQYKVSPRAEKFLYMASRVQNIEEIVYPAIKQGKIVVCDRFIDSSLAYQGGGRELTVEDVLRSNIGAINVQDPEHGLVEIWPDLTIVYEIDVEEGFRRIEQDGRKLDRLEQQEKDFHERTREVYLKLAKGDYDIGMDYHPERFLVLEGRKTKDELEALTARAIREILKKKGFPISF